MCTRDALTSVSPWPPCADPSAGGTAGPALPEVWACARQQIPIMATRAAVRRRGFAMRVLWVSMPECMPVN